MLNIAGRISVSGGKGKIIEFFGPGTQTLGATAMATVCNMSAEVGSTSCIFPFSKSISKYLDATNRHLITSAARANQNLLTADPGSEKFYDEVIEIDLNTLEPHINGPFTPDLTHPLSEFAKDIRQSDWPRDISHALIGSCTNASYEDLSKAARVFREASNAGLKPKMPVFVTAGSEKIRSTVEREGILADFENAGAVVLSNSCGPCVGQWHRHGAEKVMKSDTLMLQACVDFCLRARPTPSYHPTIAISLDATMGTLQPILLSHHRNLWRHLPMLDLWITTQLRIPSQEIPGLSNLQDLKPSNSQRPSRMAPHNIKRRPKTDQTLMSPYHLQATLFNCSSRSLRGSPEMPRT